MAQSQINPSNLDAESLKDMVTWDIQSPINRTHYYSRDLPYGITVTKVEAITAGGTFNLSFGGNHGVMGNIDNVVISTSGSTLTPSSHNVFIAGDTVSFEISNVTNAILAEVYMYFTRTYPQT